ncbi:MAG: chromosomal replication initiator protein DnaA [Clostridia bacterium]|nr:chromosomal replication initiator protein DnaA [Clostridia bacterium]
MEEKAQFGTLWSQIREAAKKIVNPISFNTFVENLTPVDVVNRKIVLKAETELTAKVITGTLADLIRKSVVSADVGLVDFIVVVDGSSTYTLDEIPDAYEETPVLLDHRYTFESFVEGTSNKFVYAAAKSVAEAPGENFNPLYIYGGTGLGKTHLMQAIANEIAAKKPQLKVLYTTSENFLNEYVDSMYRKKGAGREADIRFRNRYRNVDVLLIDDIQFWAGKAGVQEAFFHAFNELYAMHKQIVISSDCPAKELTELEERLRTRFEQGLIADIQPPDIETKIAILKRKAYEKRTIVPDDVLAYLAKNSDNNVRTLEGRLNSVIFASKLHEEPITLKLVATALQESIANAPEQEEITSESIIRAVCNYYSFTKADILGKNKRQELVKARQICTYLMCEMLSLPLVTVGKEMGGRDHATVIYSREKITELLRVNDTIRKEVNDIKSAILKQ